MTRWHPKMTIRIGCSSRTLHADSFEDAVAVIRAYHNKTGGFCAYYLEDDDGNKTKRVSDFYITDFAFKKIVYSYTSLLSGKAFDADTAYGD
jgi:hypothetical protein